MDRVDCNSLNLELTRVCNLKCIHCLRGDSQNEFMDIHTIEQIFSNFGRINKLLLTGGEPLLAVEQISRIIEIIKRDGIEVDTVKIITNGTVLGEKQIELLDSLGEISNNLLIGISSDKFHLMEIERMGLSTLRDKNISILKELYGALELKDYDSNQRVIIRSVGRAQELTREDIYRINNVGKKTNYVLSTDTGYSSYKSNVIRYKLPYYSEDSLINGDLNFDVHGNLLSAANLSFDDEDKESTTGVRNIKITSLPKVIEDVIRYGLLTDKEQGQIWREFYQKEVSHVKKLGVIKTEL